MKTEIIKINPASPDEALLKEAAECIKRGGLVAFPTETVYGLGADTFNGDAVGKIYKAKGRPSDNPLISHIADIDEVDKLALFVPENAKKLMEAFWGGPLTVILKRKNTVPDIVSANLDTVSIRMPSHPIANMLIKLAATPIAAPSANLSGSPSPTTFEHCKADMDGRVDMIIDGGACSVGVESTVVDMTGEIPVILRPGAITREHVASVCGDCIFGGEYASAPKCPGMKYTHYSPKADVYAVNDIENIVLPQDENVGIITYDKFYSAVKSNKFYSAGNSDDEYAARLFYLLRKADEDGIKTIYASLPENKGMGTAVRNRLLKSAGGKVI